REDRGERAALLADRQTPVAGPVTLGPRTLEPSDRARLDALQVFRGEGKRRRRVDGLALLGQVFLDQAPQLAERVTRTPQAVVRAGPAPHNQQELPVLSRERYAEFGFQPLQCLFPDRRAAILVLVSAEHPAAGVAPRQLRQLFKGWVSDRNLQV